MGMNRQVLTEDDVADASTEAMAQVAEVLGEKARGTMTSDYEILGALVNAVGDFNIAMSQDWSSEEKALVLRDVAALAIIGIASIRSGGTDR